MRRHWQDRRTLLTTLYFAGFLLPALLASIVRPFALWDYLTSADLLHFGRPIAWSALLSNLWHHLLVNTYIVRPTVSLLYDLQTLLFGGEFWLWYVVKWAAFVACVLAVTTLLERLGCGWWARAAVASLLLFHPARFTLML
ncbi:MAG: hypothetical protein JNK48_01070, partial [Bryobacterales bacterium]|nr:hypothetical protein [Bryobacterales bacterium]